MTLNSFMDRLGLDDEDIRTCVFLAFVSDNGGGQSLTEEQATECLTWVSAFHEKTMEFDTFCTLLEELLKELGNPLEPDHLVWIADCMLSGHSEPDEPEGANG